MILRLAVSIILILLVNSVAGEVNFIYNSFLSANLSLHGIAEVASNGHLKLTNGSRQRLGHAFYPFPIRIKNSTDGTVFSFSTTFAFAILPEYGTMSGHGLAFVISPTRGLPGALASQFLGLFNETNNQDAKNHVVAVELDTIQSKEFNDTNDNHVGIDLNGLKSNFSGDAGYYVDGSRQFRNLSLISRQPLQVWVEYDGKEQKMNVTLAPLNVSKPQIPLLSSSLDLSPILNEVVYVGFSSSTGSIRASHYVLGWSFMINGQANALDISQQLQILPRRGGDGMMKFLTIGLPLICAIVMGALYYVIKRKRKFADMVEDWEKEYGPQRFKYKDLYMATKGFRDKELLGTGGFGQVYKGTLPKSSSKMEIAVKRVSHESSHQGMREFVAEIVSMGRLRHRNLVQLLGYCRRKGELLLVYDYMPNGSLDKYLYDEPKVTLNWGQRFKVIKGVALGLFYLHEEWEQVVVHRDVKASNVLLDGELNGRLGDFGLARLYDRGNDPQTTLVMGTLGYLAPEHTRTGKATTTTDVFAFGAFLLEVACGRRPIEQRAGLSEDVILVDVVFSFWQRGKILDSLDPKLWGGDVVTEEAELVLKLGLLCSHSDPRARPSMRQVVQYLERDVLLLDLPALGLTTAGITFAHHQGFDPSYTANEYSDSSFITKSILSGGR